MFGMSAATALAVGAGGAMLMSSMGSSGPDQSGQNAAALQQANLSAEQLAWTKQIYADTAPDRADALARAKLISNAQLDAQTKQTALTDEYANYNRTTFRPLEQGIVADASAYDTPERRDEAAGRAVAGVETSLAAQRGATMRDMERSGVNPSNGKMMAMQGAMDLGAAKLKVGADTAARTQIETLGAAKKMDAASLGRNLAANQATSAGIAINQGNASSANMASLAGINASGVGIMNSGYAGAQAGLAGAANTYGNIANTQAKANDSSSSMYGALGTVGGAYAGSAGGSAQIAAMFGSDKTKKKDIEEVSPEAALKSVEKTPVSNWAYKHGTEYDDGGKTHTGPMAQDVAKNMGEKVAPQGKKIDVISMLGTQMAAIQGLSKKVNRVMAARGIN